MPAFGATTETDFVLSTFEADGSSTFLFDDPGTSFISSNPFGSPSSALPFGPPEGTAIAPDLGYGASFNDGVGGGLAKSYAAADECAAIAEDGAQIKKSISALPPYSYGSENSDALKWADCQVDYEGLGIERCVGEELYDSLEHLLFSDLPPLFDIPNHAGEGILSSDPNPVNPISSEGKGKEVVENYTDPENYYNYGGQCHEIVPEEGCSDAPCTKRRKLLFYAEDPAACGGSGSGSGISKFHSKPLRHEIEDSLEGPTTPLQQQGSAGTVSSGITDTQSGGGGEEMQMQLPQQDLKGTSSTTGATTPPHKPQTVVAKPFSIVKPSQALGEITLNEINKRISAISAQVPPTSSTHVPAQVFAQTRIITQGQGSVTLYRTRVRDTLN